MTGLDKVANAAKMLQVLKTVAKQVVDKERPDLRVGMVHSFDRPAQTAYILFPGGSAPDNLVPVRFALDKIPSVAMEDSADGVGDVVRVAGKPGGWFILDYVTGAPLSQAIDAVINVPNIAWAEETIPVTGPGRQDYFLAHLPIAYSDSLHWGGLFQERTIWTRDSRFVTVLDAEGHLQIGDKLTFRYAYIPDNNEQQAYIDFSYVGFTRINLDGLNNGVPKSTNVHPLPAGLQKNDMLVLVLSGRDGGAVCSDPRMKKVSSYSVGSILNNVYIGYHDGVNNSDLAITLKNGNGATSQFAVSVCVAYRGEFDPVAQEYKAIRYDASRIATNKYYDSPDPLVDIPAVGGQGSGTIRIASAWAGVGGVNYNLERTGIAWDHSPANGSYCVIGVAHTAERNAGVIPSPYTSPSHIFTHTTIGLY